LDLLSPTLPFTEALVISSLPRGSLQILQPPRLSEGLLKLYAREMHACDRLTWQTVSRGQAVRANESWSPGEFENSRFHREFMLGNGLAFGIAAPLSAPVLDGYPGAVHLYRNSAGGDFSDADLARFGEFAREFDAAIVLIREQRGGGQTPRDPLQQPQRRLFILDARLHSPLANADPSVLETQLHEHLLDDARKRFEHVNGSDTADRVSLPDSRNDLWNFRVGVHRSYPALGDGPFVFYCLEPSSYDWSLLRPSDFAADPEIMRLLPAMKFMADQFHRGPTLVEISKTVHLSPFHFHRRFTELLGITPKHFLLDCQIEQAKGALLERQKDLVKIASECGFAHQSHFTSRFKQATGLTPTRWRRMAMEVSKTTGN
jgi:AraC-like DNA-binding protein